MESLARQRDHKLERVVLVEQIGEAIGRQADVAREQAVFRERDEFDLGERLLGGGSLGRLEVAGGASRTEDEAEEPALVRIGGP